MHVCAHAAVELSSWTQCKCLLSALDEHTESARRSWRENERVKDPLRVCVCLLRLPIEVRRLTSTLPSIDGAFVRLSVRPSMPLSCSSMALNPHEGLIESSAGNAAPRVGSPMLVASFDPSSRLKHSKGVAGVHHCKPWKEN